MGGRWEASVRDGGCKGLPTGVVWSLEESDLGDGPARALEGSGVAGTRTLGVGLCSDDCGSLGQYLPLDKSQGVLICKRRIITKPASQG